jgi:hypothetical protein
MVQKRAFEGILAQRIEPSIDDGLDPKMDSDYALRKRVKPNNSSQRGLDSPVINCFELHSYRNFTAQEATVIEDSHLVIGRENRTSWSGVLGSKHSANAFFTLLL